MSEALEPVEPATVVPVAPYTPYRFDGTCQEKYLDGLRRGLTRHQAARSAGVNSSTARRYAARDPEFKDAQGDAESEACDPVVAVLRETALSGNLTAMMFWLQNRDPDNWKDIRRVQKEVNHSGTVTVEHEASPALERIAQLQAQLLERRELRSGPREEPASGDVVDAEVVPGDED